VSGSNGKTVQIWNVETGEQVKMLEGHSKYVRFVSFSQDGKRVVSESDGKTVQIWNVETGKQVKKLEGHSDYMRSIAFLHDGERIMSVSDDRTVQIWDVGTGEEDGHNHLLQIPITLSTQWLYSSVSGFQCWVPYSNVSACTSIPSSIVIGLKTGYFLIVKVLLQ
jgi:WD40 repeat protein